MLQHRLHHRVRRTISLVGSRFTPALPPSVCYSISFLSHVLMIGTNKPDKPNFSIQRRAYHKLRFICDSFTAIVHDERKENHWKHILAVYPVRFSMCIGKTRAKRWLEDNARRNHVFVATIKFMCKIETIRHHNRT